MWNQWKNNFSTWTLWIPDGRCFGAQSQTCWPISTSVIMFQRSYWIGCVCKCFFRKCSPFFLFCFGFFLLLLLLLLLLLPLLPLCAFLFFLLSLNCGKYNAAVQNIECMREKIGKPYRKHNAAKKQRTHSNSNNNNSIKKQLEKLSTLCMSSFFSFIFHFAYLCVYSLASNFTDKVRRNW